MSYSRGTTWMAVALTAAVTGEPTSRPSSSRAARVISAASGNPQSSVTRSSGPSDSTPVTRPGKWFRALAPDAGTRSRTTSSDADAGEYLAAAVQAGVHRADDRCADPQIQQAAGCGFHARRQHRFDPDRFRHDEVGRAPEHVGDRTDLPHPPPGQNGHAIAEPDCLVAIVRDEHSRDAKPSDGGAHEPAERRPRRAVERGERLVQQEEPRPGREGARQRDALRLPARQLAGVAIGQVGRADQVEQLRGPRRAVGCRRAGAHAVLDVGTGGEMREQGALLEDVPQPALLGRDEDLRRDVQPPLPAEADRPALGPLEARHRANHGGLAGPGGSEQDQDRARVERDAERGRHDRAAWEALLDVERQLIGHAAHTVRCSA